MRVLCALLTVSLACALCTDVDTAQCNVWQKTYDKLNGENWPVCSKNRNNPCQCVFITCKNNRIGNVRGQIQNIMSLFVTNQFKPKLQNASPDFGYMVQKCETKV